MNEKWWSGGCVVYDGEGRLVADLTNAVTCGMTPDEVEANANLIVIAVNNHEPLVEQVKLSALESCWNGKIEPGVGNERGRSSILDCPELDIPAISQCIPCKARALLADIDKESS